MAVSTVSTQLPRGRIEIGCPIDTPPQPLLTIRALYRTIAVPHPWGGEDSCGRESIIRFYEVVLHRAPTTRTFRYSTVLTFEPTENVVAAKRFTTLHTLDCSTA